MLSELNFRIMRLTLSFFICLITGVLYSQSADTLRVMTYNLLYYGEVTNFCTSTNNNINDKDDYFGVITSYVKPDVMVVNEMGASQVYADRIIANVLNANGENRYQRANIQNNGFSSLVNAVFYDKNKLAFYNQENVSVALNNSSLVRVIDIWSFYYKDPNLVENSDTVFFHVIGMHLKAGSNASDAVDRGLATEALMNFLENEYEPGYFIAAGDMNLKSSNEAAYQNLTSNEYGAYQFYDPLIPNETWSGASTFAYSHTQSTHTSSGCASGGGLDDRFDLIMMSGQLLEDTGLVNYVPNSYKAVGNDGNHYNLSLLDGTNNSAPAAVLSALYDMSDHLPVIADFSVKLLDSVVDSTDSLNGITFGSIKPSHWTIDVYDQQVEVQYRGNSGSLTVRDLSGRVVVMKQRVERSNRIDLSALKSGFYIITGNDEESTLSKKIFIRN